MTYAFHIRRSIAASVLALALCVGAAPAAAPLPRLHASGVKIVDAGGHEVLLRGINLGGWLVQEMWMCPFVQEPPAGSVYKKVVDQAGLWSTVQQRLGAAAMARVRNAYRAAWIGPSDFARIKGAGFNHVRLPFLASLVDEPGGLDWLRKAVRWAGENGLYVVLDMHGMPGGQSGDHTTGQAGVNKYFFDPVRVKESERDWGIVAKMFANNPVVAGFDLINEPTGAPNPATLHVVHDRLYRVVRQAAPATMVIVEDGYKGFDTTPHANVAGWTNVIYSLHFYQFDAKSSADQVNALKGHLPRDIEMRGYRNAPLYIGEFQIEPHGTPDAMAEYLRAMGAAGESWAVWTFKTVAPSGPMGYWGLYSNPNPANAINPFTDSEAAMTAKMAAFRTENLSPVEELLPVYRNDARGRPAAGVSAGGAR